MMPRLIPTVVIEDLNVAGMVQNQNLTQAIGDAALGMFRTLLTYQAEQFGTNTLASPTGILR
jgi:IS605 OrfB family transposase